MAQNPFLGIAETYVAELYLVLERCRTDRVFLLRYVVFGFENLVDALHTGKSHRDCVACLGELFERIDYGIEDDHVVDECRSGQRHFVKHEDTTEPQDYDNHHCTKELRHRMSKTLPYAHLDDLVAMLVVDVTEAFVHLFLGAERLDDAQTAESFLHLRHSVAPKVLSLQRARFQLSSYAPHDKAHDRDEDECEECQLPRDDKQGYEVGYDEYRVLEHHVQRGHDRVFDGGDVTCDACDDVALPLLCEESYRE